MALNKKSNEAIEKIAHAILVLHKEYKDEHLLKHRPILMRAERGKDWREETKAAKLKKWNIHGPKRKDLDNRDGSIFEKHYKYEKKLEQEGHVKTFLQLDIRDKIDIDEARANGEELTSEDIKMMRLKAKEDKKAKKTHRQSQQKK